MQKVEWCAALLATLLAAALHYSFMRHSGPLWRDEAGAFDLAVMPRLSDVWSHLYYDSFPIFWVLVLRFWAELGLGGDGGLRLLGFLTGIAILGALWFNARSLRIRLPMFSLLLLGFCPTVIVWGDSIRAWGWGCFWIVLTFGLVWRVLESPTRWNFLLAAGAAIGSVQSTYYNTVLLFAICVAGALVALRRRCWRRAALVLGIGAPAAVSFLPYLGAIRRGAGHYVILQVPYDLERFTTRLGSAVSGAGNFGTLVWASLFLAALLTGALCQFRPALASASNGQQDLLLFSLAALCLCFVGYYFFLRHLHFRTEDWYFAGLLAVAALSIDAILSVLGNSDRGRLLRIAVLVMGAGFLLPPAWGKTRMQMTDINGVAKRLHDSAGKNDLIVVVPWFCGISFQRYYEGSTPWMTLPPVEDHALHRYDVIKQWMMKPDQSEPVRGVLEGIEQTLKSGNRVWLVGEPEFKPGIRIPALLPAAPGGPAGWWQAPYYQCWSAQLWHAIQLHGQRKARVALPNDVPVNELENLQLVLVEGWQDK